MTLELRSSWQVYDHKNVGFGRSGVMGLGEVLQADWPQCSAFVCQNHRRIDLWRLAFGLNISARLNAYSSSEYGTWPMYKTYVFYVRTWCTAKVLKEMPIIYYTCQSGVPGDAHSAVRCGVLWGAGVSSSPLPSAPSRFPSRRLVEGVKGACDARRLWNSLGPRGCWVLQCLRSEAVCRRRRALCIGNSKVIESLVIQ
jgi:hypothetical protein